MASSDFNTSTWSHICIHGYLNSAQMNLTISLYRLLTITWTVYIRMNYSKQQQKQTAGNSEMTFCFVSFCFVFWLESLCPNSTQKFRISVSRSSHVSVSEQLLSQPYVTVSSLLFIILIKESFVFFQQAVVKFPMNLKQPTLWPNGEINKRGKENLYVDGVPFLSHSSTSCFWLGEWSTSEHDANC